MNKLLIYFISGLILFVSFSTIISSEKQNNYQILNEEIKGIESYTIDINIEFGSFEIKNTNQGVDVVLEDFGQITTPGKPKLPYKIISIAIPPNASPTKISYQNNNPIVLPGKYNVRAASSPNCTNSEIDINNFQEIFTNNFENTYFSTKSFPDKMIEFVRLSGYRNYHLIDLEINPFSYLPLSGILKFYPKVDITIEYEYISDQTTIINAESASTKKIARDLIFNYDQAQEWYASSNNFTTELHDFVIITLDSLTDAVEPLIQWESEKGRTVKVVTTSWIESNYEGYDTPGKIRNFLRDKYPDSEWGVEDVLIVGHYDDIPLREVWQVLPGGEKPETDFYFAELSYPDNESWDSNNNQKYGDNLDSIDFYAEVNVGRIPWSDYETVQHICEKSVNYEKNSDPSYKNNILLLAAFVDDQTDGAVYTEYIANSSINPWMDYWVKTRLYDRDSIYPMDDILNHLNVISTWTQDKFGFVAWHAHGNPYGSGNFISADDCSLLDDDYPAIISAASCSNSDTDYLNIGQAMMKQGAVGFLGANKAAYYSSGWANPNDGSDQSFKYFFTSGITSGEYTQGQALQHAIKEMYTRGLWTQLRYETFIHSSLWGNPNLGIDMHSENNPPNKPDRPNGPNEGKARQEYTFTSTSTDPENDQIYYLWSWGDDNPEWVGPFNSGEEVSASHIWGEEGSFDVKVKSKDINGAVSEWSDPIIVSMPKQKKSTINSANEWYYYPKLQNYAPSGMPDFDQRQDDWRNQINIAWSFCGPTALSNVLWYIDSKYSDSSGFPGDGNDQFTLVQDYDAPGSPDPGPSNDDHNFNNVNDLATPWEPDNELYGNELIEKVAWYTDNDGVRTSGSQTGSSSSGIYYGAVQWIEDVGLNDSIDVIVHDTKNENSLNDIINHIENEDFVLLNLGFYTSSGTSRGNHWVTVAGISRSLSKIALSDPYYDVTNYTTDYSEHNDANIVSHDIFTINNTSPLPQRSSWWLDDYEPDFASNTKAMIKDAIIIAPAIGNQPPDKPTISGPASGKSETEYTYKGVSYDDNGDQLFYLFNWGNGMTSFILGPYESGIECNASNIWFEQGEYEVKVKAIDIHNAESEWSDPLSVTMPRNIVYNPLFRLIQRLMDFFPWLEDILQPLYNMLLNL